MKSIVSCVGILVLAAALTAHSAPQQETTDEKIAKLEMKTRTELDKAFAVYSELQRLLEKIEKRVAALENENQLLKLEIKRVTDKLATGTTPKDPTPKDPTPKDPEMTDAAMKIDSALTKLKAGGSVEEAAKELVPLSKWSTGKMCEALGKNIMDMNFTKSLEQILAKCPAADLKVPLGDAVRDRMRRASVARVIGAVGDKELSKVLEVYIGESGFVDQLEIGKALLGCRNRLGVPPLLKALKAPDSDTRFLAITYLKQANHQEGFAYDYNRSVEDNAAAIKSWESWWEKSGAKLFE